MARQNFLLGKGERLTTDIVVKSGGGPKETPYTIAEARDRLAPMVTKAADMIDELPEKACPGDEAVISLTLNPEYIAKSYFPNDLLRDVGIEVVGSRPKRMTPAKRSRGRETVETVTTELFARGLRSSIRTWSQNLPSWRTDRPSARALPSIEEVSAPVPKNKIKGELPRSGRIALEAILHAGELELGLTRDFAGYLEMQKIDVRLGRRFFAKGLCFQELDAPVERAGDIAAFTGVRVLRQMPELRVLRPTVRSSAIPTRSLKLPEVPPFSGDVRVAIFDGGVPKDHPFIAGVNPIELPGMTAAPEEYLSHGVGVSSAALFGNIDPKEALPCPYSYIDHYRVIDGDPGPGSARTVRGAGTHRGRPREPGIRLLQPESGAEASNRG